MSRWVHQHDTLHRMLCKIIKNYLKIISFYAFYAYAIHPMGHWRCYVFHLSGPMEAFFDQLAVDI